ncbi:hypothetical protein LEMLEM_LOCUS10836 [Lemmus lemmus]
MYSAGRGWSRGSPPPQTHPAASRPRLASPAPDSAAAFRLTSLCLEFAAAAADALAANFTGSGLGSVRRMDSSRRGRVGVGVGTQRSPQEQRTEELLQHWARTQDPIATAAAGAAPGQGQSLTGCRGPLCRQTSETHEEASSEKPRRQPKVTQLGTSEQECGSRLQVPACCPCLGARGSQDAIKSSFPLPSRGPGASRKQT